MVSTRGCVTGDSGGAAVRCQTCPQVLTASDVRGKIRRCKACRVKAPGQIVKKHGHNRGGGPGWRLRPSVSVSKRLAVPGSAESWWIGLDRARLNAEAERRFVTYARPTYLAVNTKGGITGFVA